jgi:hypothetical protein
LTWKSFTDRFLACLIAAVLTCTYSEPQKVTNVPKHNQITLLVIVWTRIEELDVEVSSFFSQNVMLQILACYLKKLPVNKVKHFSLCPQ